MLLHTATFSLFAALLALTVIDVRTRRSLDGLTLPPDNARTDRHRTSFRGDLDVARRRRPRLQRAGRAGGDSAVCAAATVSGREDAKLMAAEDAWCGTLLVVASLAACVLLRHLMGRGALSDRTALAFRPWHALGIAAC